MKLKDVIKLADEIKPNAFSNEVKTLWLNEVEGLVMTEVLLLTVHDVAVYAYTYSKHENTTMMAKPPHDKIYTVYLCAMIDFHNGEYDKYQNTMQMFNAYFSEYMRWYAREYRPADGGDVRI